MHGPALLLSALLAAAPLIAQQPPAQRPPARSLQEDVIPTSAGDLTITFVGHGTVMFRHGGKVIHVDPVSREADYSMMPKADLILITHEHGDHLDTAAVELLRKDGTQVVVSPSCEGRVQRATVMRNGESREVSGFRVEALPAYNLVHTRAGGIPYHPRGNGNGYLITFADVRVYVAGDTENTPEMMALRDIAVAFLPMNLPYTMTPEMVADAARSIRPRILYPYHFGQTDPQVLVRLLAGEAGIEVRVREMR